MKKLHKALFFCILLIVIGCGANKITKEPYNHKRQIDKKHLING